MRGTARVEFVALRLSRGINGKAPERREASRFLALRIQSPGDFEPGGELPSSLGLRPGHGFGRWLTMHHRRSGFANAQFAPVGLGLAQLYFQLRYSFAARRGVSRRTWPDRNEGQSHHHVTCEGPTNRPAHLVSPRLEIHPIGP